MCLFVEHDYAYSSDLKINKEMKYNRGAISIKVRREKALLYVRILHTVNYTKDTCFSLPFVSPKRAQVVYLKVMNILRLDGHH
jgi:hypothetical protein